MKKIGLVLDGGGGKGSYHIGVWKYLKEVGLDNNIKAISGTSVGGLNACLFALNNYELAETIWTQKIQDKILSFQKLNSDSFKDNFDNLTNLLHIPLNISKTIFNAIKMLAFKGIFSRDGLLSLIDEYIDLDAISNMYFPIYATCTELPLFKTEYIKLNGKDKYTIKKILLSTSAIPIIFPYETVYIDDKKSYWDGGLKDNSPIKPLCENEKCTDIIVIHLDPFEIIKDRPKNVNIYEIYPKKDLGNAISGVLDFSPEGAFRRINQGYEDAKRILSIPVDIAKTSAKTIYNLKKMQEDDIIFDKKIQNYQDQIKKKLDNF